MRANRSNRATLTNMRRLADRAGVVVLDRDTWETYSANPSDYFWLGPDDCLTNDDGRELVLVRRVPARLVTIR